MLSPDQEQLLVGGARLFQIQLSEETVAHFSIFIEEIQRWSRITDLLSQTDPDTLIRKHILDSLVLLPLLPSGIRVLDLGSGAGFPGLPIAIAHPGIQVDLVEARRKRVNFLKEVVRVLNLRNSSVVEGRAEKLAEKKEWQARFDVITTRATWNITSFLRLASPFLRLNGIAIAMKGPKLQEELIKLTESGENQGFSAPHIILHSLPGNEKRNIAVFTKIDH